MPMVFVCRFHCSLDLTKIVLLIHFQIASVDKYVNSINSQMQQQHDRERLEAIMMKIEQYEAVDAPNDECVKVGEFLLQTF